MPSGPPRRSTIELVAVTFSCSHTAADHGWAACLACDGRLSLLQPDPETPECLLGVCRACGRWHLASFHPAWVAGTLVRLPVAEEFSCCPGVHSDS